MKKTVDVSIPLGPMHPVWKEPCRLKCETIGEQVIRAEMELGYMKKGIERIMRGRPWQEVMFLAERVCGICSVIHNMVFIEAMEQLSDIAVPDRAASLRVIVNELDRIASHMIANFSFCYTIEHETLGMYILNTRETVLDMLERITGARVTCAYIIPGGVRFDLLDEDREALLSALDTIEADTRRYITMFDEGPLIALRSRGVGTLTPEQARESHAVGPTARASGIAEDPRRHHPTYPRLGVTPVVLTGGDNHDRIMLRFLEIIQSVDLIRTAVTTLPDGSIRGGGIMKKGTVEYAGEAPRGELKYRIKADSYGRIQEIFIQTPSIMNIEACVHYMIPCCASIADVSATYISSDPCVACTER